MRLHLRDHKSLKFEKLYVAQAVCPLIGPFKVNQKLLFLGL